MGVLADGGSFSTAFAVSSDGSVVVGGGNSSAGTVGIRWTRSGGPEAIPGSTDAMFAVSGDGLRSAGTGTLFTVGAPPISLGDAEISAMNHDGSRLTARTGPVHLWSQDQGWTALPGLTSALDITQDGNWVLGTAGSSIARWSAATGTQVLGPGRPANISEDGRIIAGDHNGRVIRWREGVGIEDLGNFPNTVSLETKGMSGDGSVIVGLANVRPPGQNTRPVPFLWTAHTGLLDLRSYLNTLGIPTSGFSFLSIEEISLDGRTLVGFGFNPESQITGIIAHVASLPAPSSVGPIALGLFMLGRRNRR